MTRRRFKRSAKQKKRRIASPYAAGRAKHLRRGETKPRKIYSFVYLFALFSILFHAVLLILAFFMPKDLFPYFNTPKQAVIPPKKITLTLAPLLQQQQAANEKQFIDSNESLRAAKPNTPTPFESERTTQSASQIQGQGAPFLPTLAGTDPTRLNLQNSRASIAQNQAQPSHPHQPSQQNQQMQQAQNSATQPPDPNKTKQKEDLKPDKPSNSTTVASSSSGRLPIQAQTETSKPIQEPSKNSTPKIEDSPTSENSPPASFSADRRASTMQGSAPIGPSSSIASQESELGRYKAKLYRAIGSRWYLYVDQQKAFVEIGRVHLRFYVRADGTIDPPQATTGNSNSVLTALSIRSVADVGTLEPFSDTLREQLGEGYWEEVTFTIY